MVDQVTSQRTARSPRPSIFRNAKTWSEHSAEYRGPIAG